MQAPLVSKTILSAILANVLSLALLWDLILLRILRSRLLWQIRLQLPVSFTKLRLLNKRQMGPFFFYRLSCCVNVKANLRSWELELGNLCFSCSTQ
jgi:hypothetical protein